MKVIIAGSRHMPKTDFYQLILGIINSGFNITEEVCGKAKGADTWGWLWAKSAGIPTKEFPAEWDKYGKAAGPIRNKQMADYADALIVFIYQNSRGSKNMLEQMQKLGKPCYVVEG